MATLCWNCGKRSAVPRATVRIELERNPRFHSFWFAFVAFGWTRRAEVCTVDVPRCRECKRERRIEAVTIMLWFISGLAAIFALVWIFNALLFSGSMAAFLSVVTVAGLTIYNKRRQHVDLGMKRHSLMHPAILELREQGWTTLDTPPTPRS